MKKQTKYNYIQPLQINSDCYECSVSVWNNDVLLKFNEGHYLSIEQCLDRCIEIAKGMIANNQKFMFVNYKEEI